MYADDTQVYIELSQSDTHKSISSLSDCLTDISLWMKSSKLKLNSDKTEFIIIGTKRQRHKLSNHFPVKLLDNDICPSDSVRNLGVVFDSDFSFHKHVSNIICKSCFYHIRDLWAAVFTFNPYLLISINELMISIIHLLISINELLISINELLVSINELLISINTSSSTVFIDINNSFIDINKGIIDINNSFIDVNKYG